MKLPVVFRIISILFLVFIQQSLLIAQVDGDEGYLTASLKITDEKKNPISSVKIIFTDLNTNQVEYKSTVNGKVKIKLRLDRNYLIIASDPLYYTKTVEIRTEIKKLGYRTAFYSDIDISLLLNCENDPSRSNILGEPVGRVIYDNYKQKFVYDTRYTETKASLYMAEYYKRCEEVEKEKALALAAEKQKLELLKQSELTEKQRLEEEKRKRKEAEKKANEEEQTRIAAENEKQKQLEKEEKARLKAEEEQQKKLAEEERIRKEAEETARIKAENDKRIRQEVEESWSELLKRTDIIPLSL
ncbi:MAG: hypothetical protein H8E61_03020, partial [Bacteroidetes bacterium]|nr:hypothetical protein [Bacteroidota bacterium]